MKRSEMIKLIENILKNNYDNPAITILQKLEDVGMSPPKVEGIYKTSKIHGERYYHMPEWKWEPEDSKTYCKLLKHYDNSNTPLGTLLTIEYVNEYEVFTTEIGFLPIDYVELI